MNAEHAASQRRPEVDELHAARELLGKAAALTDLPAVYQAIQVADMNLHWACWQLGDVEHIAPQITALNASEPDDLIR